MLLLLDGAGALWEYPPYMSGGDAAAAGRWALATAEGLEGFLDVRFRREHDYMWLNRDLPLQKGRACR